jgi:PPOX class probable F420-dependent enzyme
MMSKQAEGIFMLDDKQRELLDKQAFAKLVTLMADGHPQGTVMWYRRDGDTIRMMAPESAVKTKNLDQDARATVIVDDPDSGYNYVELRCRCEVVHDDAAAREELHRIASRYIGDGATDFVAGLDDAPRVMFIFRPFRVQGQIRD